MHHSPNPGCPRASHPARAPVPIQHTIRGRREEIRGRSHKSTLRIKLQYDKSVRIATYPTHLFDSRHFELKMSSYLITGAGRGLGLELVRQLSQRSPREVSAVFATIRGPPSEALQELVAEAQGRIIVMHMVVTDKDSIAAAVGQVRERLGGRGLDVLINNTAIMETSLDGVASMDNLRNSFQVNVEAVHDVTAAFLPLLREGSQKKVLNL